MMVVVVAFVVSVMMMAMMTMIWHLTKSNLRMGRQLPTRDCKHEDAM